MKTFNKSLMSVSILMTGIFLSSSCVPIHAFSNSLQRHTTFSKPIRSNQVYIFNPKNRDIDSSNKDWKQVAQNAQVALVKTTRQFSSGFMSGYALSFFWGIFRGISPERNMAWGLDFGALSAIFTACDFLPSVNMLWNIVIRNVLLSIYFGRKGTILSILKKALLYGGLTYYFVGNKMKRNAENGGNNMNMADFFQSMQGGQQTGNSNVAMEELIRQMQSRAAAATSNTNNNTSSSPSVGKNDAGESKKKKKKRMEENAMDVEWERIDNEDDAEDKS